MLSTLVLKPFAYPTGALIFVVSKIQLRYLFLNKYQLKPGTFEGLHLSLIRFQACLIIFQVIHFEDHQFVLAFLKQHLVNVPLPECMIWVN